MKHTATELKQKQSLPLEAKIQMTKNRVQQWLEHWDYDCYVSFSGGKDSTVLLDIVRQVDPEIKAVFVDTGLEYPEIKDFIRTINNVEWVKPKKSFRKVVEEYGFPVISKEQSRYIRDCQNPKPTNAITRRRRMTGVDRNGVQTKSGMISKKWRFLIDAPFRISEQCCDHLKKNPLKSFQKTSGLKPIVGTMVGDSRLRRQSYLRVGCNSFKNESSTPMSFWNEKDVWEYLKKYKVPYSKIYDMGETRTGCMFCMFGVHLEKGSNRFQRMKINHPKQYDFCIKTLGLGKVLNAINVEY